MSLSLNPTLLEIKKIVLEIKKIVLALHSMRNQIK